MEQTENPEYLTRQIITCLGNKRSLLDFIGTGVEKVRQRLNREKLSVFDVFSGSGIAARYFKRFASLLLVNDLEYYSAVINRCYLSNQSGRDTGELFRLHRELLGTLDASPLKEGIISGLYAPADDSRIREGERVFYTRRNAMYIDTARQLIETLPESTRDFFLAPLLSEASVHANTSGVFKGFYKDRKTGLGSFGGGKGHALGRIRGDITLPFPVFSSFDCEVRVSMQDAKAVISEAPETDMAYLDPPYNQHPYGSNYFMLNLIARYEMPRSLSPVSGIPEDWNRSVYNTAAAGTALEKLVAEIKAKFVLLSFNSEGFMGREKLLSMLGRYGKTELLERNYNTFRGSRNLQKRNIHVTEYLYILEKQ